ncbi:MAG: radical SAM protein [Myxococcales bacterium]|nr:radical SAM protein [Myxococcales bacterium]
MALPRALAAPILTRRGLERGAPFPGGRPRKVAMVYPSPYRVGMSSLGFQWISSVLAERGFQVERVFLPEDVEAWRKARACPVSEETLTPLSEFPILCVSLAYELELVGLIELLRLAGIPPLRRDRRRHRSGGHPTVLLGGPLTFSNALPAAPFVDGMILGEAEDVVADAIDGFFADGHLGGLAALPGGYVPDVHGETLPPVARADDTLLPARSRIWTPETELHDMFLIEGERGCHRSCTFCVMRRDTKPEPVTGRLDRGGMRLITPDRLLELIPAEAPRVGLVGAAISDHPQLVGLLEALLDAGKGIGISSLRGDRVALKPDIPRLLRLGGYKTLTVASDAASQRLRRTLSKGTTEAQLLACAEAAREHKYRLLKVYMMLGVPDEQDEDIEELITFTRRLAAIHPVALGIAPFVPKRNTPLDGAPFAGIAVVDKRLDRVRAGLKGVRAEVRPTSARWAWVEHQLAQAGWEGGEACLRATEAGGAFADWKREFGREGFPAPWRVVSDAADRA